MRRAVFALIVLVVTAASCTTPSRPASVQKSNKDHGVPVATLTGTPAEMGTQHGKTFARQIKPLHDEFLRQWIRSDMQRMMAFGVAQQFEPFFRPEHLEELNALAAASGVDSQQMLLSNCFLDVGGMVSCSTLTLDANASADGVPRFARNLDFPSFNIADKHTIVLVQKPNDGRYAYASVGWPGLVGVLSGMNEHGLTLANMEVTRDRRPPTAMPYALLYRTLLERCRTVEEALDLLEKTPKQTSNNLMLMDATGSRALVEIYPDRIEVRRARQPDALISTNHRRFAGPPVTKSSQSYCSRYDRLEEQSGAQWGKLDVSSLQKMLADVAQGDMTLQSMIFEPTTRVMYLAVGKNAPKQRWERIDLKPLMD